MAEPQTRWNIIAAQRDAIAMYRALAEAHRQQAMECPICSWAWRRELDR